VYFLVFLQYSRATIVDWAFQIEVKDTAGSFWLLILNYTGCHAKNSPDKSRLLGHHTGPSRLMMIIIILACSLLSWVVCLASKDVFNRLTEWHVSWVYNVFFTHLKMHWNVRALLVMILQGICLYNYLLIIQNRMTPPPSSPSCPFDHPTQTQNGALCNDAGHLTLQAFEQVLMSVPCWQQYLTVLISFSSNPPYMYIYIYIYIYIYMNDLRKRVLNNAS
jgi:hypothetical protein